MKRVVALAAIALLLCGDDAAARVGGGQDFSTGGGSDSFGSGGDDGLGLILYLLIRLCFEYPAIGIPLLLLFLGFLAVRAFWQRYSATSRVHRTHDSAGPAPARRAARGGMDRLRADDPALSVPVLLGYLQLVHRRALEALGTGAWTPLAPFVADGARTALQRSAPPGITSITGVVYGGLRIEGVTHPSGRTRLEVRFFGSRREHRGDGVAHVYFEEWWAFARDAGAISLPPDEVLRLGCPSCGSAIETDRMGRCSHCETPITKGQLTWQAVDMKGLVRRPLGPPDVRLRGGGVEDSVRASTRRDRDLQAQYRAFVARHPDFRSDAFDERVRDVFLALQSAWSDGAWDRARPFVTDPMYNNLRFYLEQYAESSLSNRLADVRLERSELVKVELDPWYEALTVRLWATMKDWVEDAAGAVVGGDPKSDRHFSEYWTFLRAAGTGAGTTDAVHCPSCGAPLDRISQAGICGYCDSRITSGRFDWVLSRIDQPAVYQG